MRHSKNSVASTLRCLYLTWFSRTFCVVKKFTYNTTELFTGSTVHDSSLLLVVLVVVPLHDKLSHEPNLNGLERIGQNCSGGLNLQARHHQNVSITSSQR